MRPVEIFTIPEIRRLQRHPQTSTIAKLVDGLRSRGIAKSDAVDNGDKSSWGVRSHTAPS